MTSLRWKQRGQRAARYQLTVLLLTVGLCSALTSRQNGLCQL